MVCYVFNLSPVRLSSIFLVFPRIPHVMPCKPKNSAGASFLNQGEHGSIPKKLDKILDLQLMALTFQLGSAWLELNSSVTSSWTSTSAMGCIGSVNVDHDASKNFIKKWRGEGKGKDFLLMGIKDQNMTGKVLELFTIGPEQWNLGLLGTFGTLLADNLDLPCPRNC